MNIKNIWQDAFCLVDMESAGGLCTFLLTGSESSQADQRCALIEKGVVRRGPESSQADRTDGTRSHVAQVLV